MIMRQYYMVINRLPGLVNNIVAIGSTKQLQLEKLCQFSTGPGRCGHKYLKKISHNQKSVSYKFDSKKIMANETESEWICAGTHQVHAWSISGFETCIVVRGDGFRVAFDMGYPTRPAVNCQHVFITHGHIDHISGIVQHAARRSLFGLKPATYYVPGHLKEPLQAMAANVGQMHGSREDFSNIQIETVTKDDHVKFSGGLSVRCFPTCHRVPSQGYILYKSRKVLKPEYQDLTGPEIGRLVKEGVEVHHVNQVPEVAYTGDTRFEVFYNPTNPDLLKAKTLITETTYIDNEVDKSGKGAVERARDRGHAHLQELIDSRDLFTGVGNIVLIHFSDKYSVNYLRKRIQQILPDDLKHKVHIGTLMKETVG